MEAIYYAIMPGKQLVFNRYNSEEKERINRNNHTTPLNTSQVCKNIIDIA
jgi:hypothetical protein